MYKRLIVLTAAVALGLSASTVLAQCGCGAVEPAYVPAAPSYSTYYAPTATYYAPAPTTPRTMHRRRTPRTTRSRTPRTTRPRAYATYYVQPYATYYAPASCGTCYSPVVGYYGVAGRSMFGAPRVYVPGQPVRNVFRAVTPLDTAFRRPPAQTPDVKPSGRCPENVAAGGCTGVVKLARSRPYPGQLPTNWEPGGICT